MVERERAAKFRPNKFDGDLFRIKSSEMRFVRFVSVEMYLFTFNSIHSSHSNKILHTHRTNHSNFSEKIQFDSTEKNRCAAIFVHDCVCLR